MIFKNDCALKLCLWILALSTVHTYGQHSEFEFECGAHGRFEYCIDGIPGCVIGCHCHPGYFFDTDSKICEPNIKLTKNFRRQYDFFEPTRVYPPPVTLPVLEEPATTIRNAVDEKLDLITKDADDLGDWLYNQFFKTIENETNDEGILTRRSGNDFSVLSKPSRRSHKYWKAKRKKKRKKNKKGLRGKLLRITEDDSLFDSSSGSGSDESSSSSSGSSSNEAVEEKKEKKEEHDKDGHGHKKIIMFNKRPKPPLPSFIFLPNMDTPFFPPIGLPPPMPMYPMVPVPPMMGPHPFAAEAIPHTHDETSTASVSSTSEYVSTSFITTTTPPPAAPAKKNAPDDNLKNAEKNKDRKESEESNGEPQAPGLRGGGRFRGEPRHKLMHKLREKLKRKNKLQNYFANVYQEPTPPFMNVKSPPNCIANPEPDRNIQLSGNLAEELRGLKDVDFKYLSQLIHRADLNKSHPSTSKELLTDVATKPPPSRRSNNDNYPDITQLFYNLASQPRNQQQPLQTDNVTNNVPPPYRNKIEALNDTYYSNLGRQIATMIRNLDGDKEFDLEITKSNTPSSHPDFNGNSQGSRSYWERSVRSPLYYLKNTLRKEKRYFKYSNENLFSLENKVEIAASTKPNLGLHELENIINKMERAKSKLIRKHVGLHRGEPSKISFNVNLLPGNDRVNAQSFSDIHSSGVVNKKSQHDETKYLPFKTYTKSKNVKTPSRFEPEKYPYAKDKNGQQSLGSENNVYIRRGNVQLSSQPGPETNAYTKSQNGQSPSQLGPENNVYTRRRNERPLPQRAPENYFSIMYRNSLPDTVNSRNQTALKTIFGSPLLPTRKPNTVESQAKEYNIPNTVEAPQYKSPDTIVIQQYKIPNNVIEQQHKRPYIVVAQQQKNPINVLEQQQKGPNTIIVQQYKIPNAVVSQKYKIPNKFQSYTVLPLPWTPPPPKLDLLFMEVNKVKPHNHQLNPTVFSHKNFKSFSGSDDNQFLFDKPSLPLKFSSLPWYRKQLLKPSYFHHELHHFDYFDDLS